ncbi:MAG: type II secretion system F family protein [Microthrixaceae bacterium]
MKGEIVAASANMARNELAVQGVRVRKISERKGFNVDVMKQRIPLVEIMHFSRQMATFLRAGVPMTEALDNMREASDNKRFTEVLSDIYEKVSSGRSLTDSIALHAEIFPAYFLAMLSAAELTGRMDQAFDQVYGYIKRDVALSRAVRKALIYPVILLGLSAVVVLIIVVFAIPKFAEFFEDFDAELPLPTRMLMAVADFVQSPAGMITGAVLLIGGIGLVLWIRTPNGRRMLHKFLLTNPVTRTVVTYSATERFTRVFSALLETGVPLPSALPTAVDSSNNIVYKERLTVAMEGVLEGQGFAGPLASTELFPNTVIQMIKVGERSGELSTQLENAANFYEEELEYAIDKMTALFEPITIVLIGSVVGFVALAMISAMYGIYNQVDF